MKTEKEKSRFFRSGLSVMAVAILARTLEFSPFAAEPAPAVQARGALIGAWPGYDRTAPTVTSVQGSTLYLDNFSSTAVDISDPAHLKFIPAPPKPPERIYDGERFYTFEAGVLRAFDNRNPARPVNIGALLPPVGVSSPFQIKNNRLYESPANNTPLKVWDVADISKPTLLSDSSVVLPSLVAMMGPDTNGRLYVVDLPDGQHPGLKVIDVRDPAHPVLEGQTDLPDPLGAMLVGPYLYAPSYISTKGMQIINVSDPANPGLAQVYMPSTMLLEAAAPGGKYIYLRDAGGISIVDTTNPANPTRIGRISQSNGSGLVLAGDILYTALNGIEAFNVSNPAVPTKYPRLTPPTTALVYSTDVEVVGSTAYLTDTLQLGTGATGVEVLDVSDPSRPVKLSTLTGATSPRFVRARGSRLYVTEWYSPNIYLYDIANPRTPKLLGSFSVPTTTFPLNADFTLNRAYALTPQATPDSNASRLTVFDTTDPKNIKMAGFFPLQNYGVDVMAEGNVVVIRFLDEAGAHALILDVTDPKNILKKGLIDGQFLALKDGKLFIADSTPGSVAVYDVTKAAPQLVGRAPSTIGKGSGKYHIDFWLNSGSPTLVDASDPASPKPVGPIALPPRNLLDVEIQGDILYTANGNGGLAIYKLVTTPLETIADDFSDGNDAGWLRWSPFAAFGAPATFTVETGAYKITSPKSPAPQVLNTYAGADQVEVNFTDVDASVDVTGWLAGPNDSSSIALQVRGEAQPNSSASWYSAQFTPRPTPQAEGTGISTHPNLAIVKVKRTIPATLAIQNFPDNTFSADKTYTITMKAEGPNLHAMLYEKNGATSTLVSDLVATDSDLDHGYAGVNSFDRLGYIGKGNNPIQFIVDNFSAVGPTAPPTIRIDKNVVYWSAGMTDYVLESSDTVRGGFAPANLSVTKGTDGFINMATPSKTEPMQFFRLRKP